MMDRSEARLPSGWTVPVMVEDLPDGGRHFKLAADVTTREAVAKIAGLRALPRLEAEFEVTRRGVGVHVSGQVNADIGQTCVVTLDPIDSTVTEPVDLVFAPPLETDAKKQAGPRRRKKSEEPPEPLVEGVLDLGVVATEFLILGLDPYPRKPGAEFAQPNAGNGGAHPFAALDVIKKRSGSDLK